jgi:hypothetical protein
MNLLLLWLVPAILIFWAVIAAAVVFLIRLLARMPGAKPK